MLALRLTIIGVCVFAIGAATVAGQQQGAPPAGAPPAGAPTAPPPPAQGAPATDAETPVTRVWPQSAIKDGITYTMDKPKVLGLDNHIVNLRAPLQVTMSDGTNMSGHIDIGATVAPSDTTGEVELNHFVIGDAILNGVDDTTSVQSAMTALLGELAVSVPRRALVQDIPIDPVTTPGLKHAPPSIRVVYKPTVLLSVDGMPRTAPLGQTGWRRCTNTPFILLQDAAQNWVLRLGQNDWRASTSTYGPWSSVQAPDPAVLAALGNPPQMPEGLQQEQAEADKSRAATAAKSAPPDVIVATVPTVLISLNGAPQIGQVADGIQGATNTDSVLLRTQSPDRWWTIASGRWFAAPDLGGPWGYVAPKDLPASFANLPSTGQYGSARASVPNTVEAKEAIVAGAEMRTVTLDRAKATCDVKYTGDPKFTLIPSMQLRYATNSSQPVIQADNAYYCCNAAAWFTGAAPTGPWALCDKVPQDIYDIPASSPIYSVTYVEVMGSTPTSVTFGFTPGYIGTYMQDGTPVYGTGYAYETSDLGNGETQAYPQTYGNDAAYDSQSGTFAPPTGDTYIYEYPAVQPYYLDYGYSGWGWCNSWCVGWGWGWGGWGYWHHWGNWWNHYHPYYNHWQGAWDNWHRDNNANRQAARNAADRADGRGVGNGWGPATRNPGGERPATTPGGDRPTRNPGGERPTQNPGGERPTTNPGGERPTTNPGGERPTRNPGGERPTQYPGGERPTQNPGGGWATRYPGGEVPQRTPAYQGDYNRYSGFHPSNYGQAGSYGGGYRAPQYNGGYRGGYGGGNRGGGGMRGGGGGGRGGGGGGRR